MELKFHGNCFRKFGSTLRGCPLFRKFWKKKLPFYTPSAENLVIWAAESSYMC